MAVLSTYFTVSHRNNAHPKTAHFWPLPKTATQLESRERQGEAVAACLLMPELVRSAVVSRLITSSSFGVWREGGQPVHSSRPHNGAAPHGLSGVCGDKSRIKLISKATGPMCLPHQARNQVESINKMKGIKERVGLSCVQSPSGNDTACFPTCTLPVFISHPIGKRGRWVADKIPSVPIAGFSTGTIIFPKQSFHPLLGGCELPQ